MGQRQSRNMVTLNVVSDAEGAAARVMELAGSASHFQAKVKFRATPATDKNGSPTIITSTLATFKLLKSGQQFSAVGKHTIAEDNDFGASHGSKTLRFDNTDEGKVALQAEIAKQITTALGLPVPDGARFHKSPVFVEIPGARDADAPVKEVWPTPTTDEGSEGENEDGEGEGEPEAEGGEAAPVEGSESEGETPVEGGETASDEGDAEGETTPAAE